MANKKNRQTSLPGHDGKSFGVGEGAHTGFNGDAYPYTVLFVSDSGRKVYVSLDTYKVIDTKGAYVEGTRECEFSTVIRPIEECEVYTLSKKGHFMPKGNRGASSAWSLRHGRFYAQNPSF